MTAETMGQEIVFEVTKPKGTFSVFAKGILIGLGKAQGHLHGGATLTDFPRLRAAARDVEIDGSRIARFREVCGLPGDDAIAPPPYAEILFLDLLATIVTSKPFPVSPMGLIHIEQRITQHGLLKAGERADLDCRLAALRDTGKGIEADCTMEVRVGDELRWEGLATFLSRDMKAQGKGKTKDKRPPADAPSVEPVDVTVPDDTGRRYAKVSKDFNPHHLYPITAKLFGYKRPIAHGMWTLARAMGELDESWLSACPMSAVARFKTPILMPATVHILSVDTPEGKQIDVVNPKNGAPHLALSVTRG
jgi:hypothetical protein